MTPALEALHNQYPGRYLTAVESSCPAIFEHNPHVRHDLDGARVINMAYPLINQSGQRPVHFVQGYVDFLGQQLGLPLVCYVNRPSLYFSDEERGWINQVEQHKGYRGKFWLVCSGIKFDYTVKGWGTARYQAVVDGLRGRVQFVQVGERGHNHPPLSGVIDLRGETDARQLLRLALNAQGGIGGVSFLHHVFGALEKPFVTIASGMESASWERYNTGAYLTRQGCLPCCRLGGCWKARVVPLGDNDHKDRSLCVSPVLGPEPVPLCMDMIEPAEAIRAVESFYRGGLLTY